MKILVFSDSHRSLSGMYAAIELHQPQQVIHLGDIMYDAEEVAQHYPKLPFCLVPGNCDGWGHSTPVKKNITLGGKSILLSHGHHPPLRAHPYPPAGAAGGRAVDDESRPRPLQLWADRDRREEHQLRAAEDVTARNGHRGNIP